MSKNQSAHALRAESAVVWFIGISQGRVPHVVDGVFDGDSRFALPLLLPKLWWWIACLAVLALAVVAMLAIDSMKERAVPESGEDAPVAEAGGGGYDALSGLVLLVGSYSGLAPFVARLVFGGDLFLTFTLRLPVPWWWLASLGVVVLTVVLLEWIDRPKQRATGSLLSLASGL